VTSGCLGEKTTPVTRQNPPVILVEYERTGGIAGLNDRLVIFNNGAAIISGKAGSHEIALNETELANISELFADAKFPALDSSYTARHGAADVIRYTITYNGKIVVAEDTAIPSALQPVIDEFNRIIITGLPVETIMQPFANIPGT
jgi:uncharacterized protein CbrC (UPF0167 family)